MMELCGKTYSELSILLEEEKRTYNEVEDRCLKDNLSWDDAKDKLRPAALNIFQIEQEMRLVQDPEMEFGKEYKGERMTLEEFIDKAKRGIINDNNGVGYYATYNGKSNVRIYATDAIENKTRSDFSHVIWM